MKYSTGLDICIDIYKLSIQLRCINRAIAWVVASRRGRSRSGFGTAIARRLRKTVGWLARPSSQVLAGRDLGRRNTLRYRQGLQDDYRTYCGVISFSDLRKIAICMESVALTHC